MLRSFLIFVLTLQCATAACPAGWELIDGRECRGLYKTVITQRAKAFDTAVAKCNEVLATPIIIHNKEEQDYWTKQVNKRYNLAIHGAGDFYPEVMGLSCNKTAKRWEWADGSELDYRPEDPNDYDSVFAHDWCNSDYYASMWEGGYWMLMDNNPHSLDEPDIFCTMPVRQPVPPDDGCDSTGDDSEDGVCYQITKTASNWEDAKEVCGDSGATVASVHNAHANSFIRRMAVSQGAINGVLLGGIPTGKGNELGWVDGTSWDFDNFYPGFPVKGLGECLMMDTATTTGEWANLDCATNLNVVCMRQRNYLQPSCSSGPWVEGQTIYSPGYPYDASTLCDFILSVDAGKKVELEVLQLEANPCCDNLVLYENYFGSTEIANLTGIINNEKYTSSSNYMRVSWQPNGGVNVKGAMMTFRAV